MIHRHLKNGFCLCLIAALCLLSVSGICAEPDAASPEPPADDSAELAKKLQNPVADLISVPLQSNWDFGIEPAGAMKYTLNVQPVIPFGITKDWTIITRTILPVIYEEKRFQRGDDHFGLGDMLQSFFLSPKEPVGGWILGAGPVLYWPTATENALGTQKFGAGPTAVVLRQDHGWTYGILANQVWSYAGSGPVNVNSLFLQPFLSFTTKTYTTLGINTESTYNWNSKLWSVPINASVTQLVKFGKLPVSFQLGYRYYAESPRGGPDWGLRFNITFLFPTGKKS